MWRGGEGPGKRFELGRALLRFFTCHLVQFFPSLFCSVRSNQSYQLNFDTEVLSLWPGGLFLLHGLGGGAGGVIVTVPELKGVIGEGASRVLSPPQPITEEGCFAPRSPHLGPRNLLGLSCWLGVAGASRGPSARHRGGTGQASLLCWGAMKGGFLCHAHLTAFLLPVGISPTSSL